MIYPFEKIRRTNEVKKLHSEIVGYLTIKPNIESIAVDRRQLAKLIEMAEKQISSDVKKYGGSPQRVEGISVNHELRNIPLSPMDA